MNESYVYCLRQKAESIAQDVKRALEKEGYEGDDASVVDKSGDRPEAPVQRTFFRREFKTLYKPFDGRIYLPRFCLRTKNGDYEGLDYFRHLISQVDIEKFNYAKAGWNLSDEMEKAKDFFYRATLGQQGLERVGQKEADFWEPDDTVCAWLVANLPYDHYSFKQLRFVVERFTARMIEENPRLRDHLGLVKFTLRNKLREFIETETDRLAEAAFDRLFQSGQLCFYLECVDCRFQIPSSVELRSTRLLVHNDNSPVQRSLFEWHAESQFNEYERKVALYLDKHPEVLWWYRNRVGEENFSVQGFRKRRIFPDFVVQNGKEKRPVAKVVVVESKGQHLAGNPDTAYKRKIADYFEKVGKKVTWQKLGEGFDHHQFRFQVLDEGLYENWKHELKRLLEAPTRGSDVLTR